MATARQDIEVRVVDKTQRALGRIDKRLGGINSRMLSLGKLAAVATTAIAAIGAAKLAKGFVNVAREMENLEVRFGFLFGSIEEGAKAFEELNKFAGEVPFSLEEIVAASGSLAVISKDAKELGANLRLAGNIAAVAGLDFKTTGEQLQRALSGGISAADLLRDRGIKAMLGFKDGVKITVEETAIALEKAFGPNGRFGNAAMAMADTLDGVVSMVGDKWLRFQVSLMDAGPFDMLKASVQLLNDVLEKNFGSIEKAGAKIGEAIVSAAEKTILGAGSILDAIMPVVSFVTRSFNNIIQATNNLPGFIKTLGVIGFLALGIKGKLLIAVIGAVYDKIALIFADIIGVLATAKRKIADFYDAIGFDEAAAKMRANADDITNSMINIKNKFGDVETEADDAVESIDQMILALEDGTFAGGKFNTMALELIAALREQRDELVKTKKDIEAGTVAQNDMNEEIKRTIVLLDKKKIMQGMITAAEAKEAKKQLFIAEQKHKRVLNFHQLEYEGVREFNRKAMEEALAREEFEKKSASDKATWVIGKGAEIFAGLGAINKKAFQAYKAFAIADAIISTYKGAAKALGAYPPPFNFIAMAATVAGGLAQVAAIRSQQYGGGKAEGGPVSGNKSYIVGEKGPEMFSPAGAGNITPNDKLGQSVNVNFTILANDTRGFDELLVSRRATIQGIINGALNRRGRVGVT